MKRLFTLIIRCFPIFLIGFLSLVAVSGSSCSSRIKSNTDDFDSIAVDSESIYLTEIEEEENDTASIPLSFNSSDEAIQYMNNSEESSRYREGILPQMAKDELSYCTKLLNSEHPYFFIVDKAQLEIVVFDKFGRELKRVGMACSKNYGTKHKRRDNRTPEGFFTAKGVYNSTEWLYTDDDGKTSDVKGQFGPRFIRLNVPVTSQIGIHGTSSPWSIGHRRSHGCIRVTNDHIMELVEYVDSGMPVIVSPGSKDMAVNEEEGFYVPAISTRRDGSKATPRGYYSASAQSKKTEAETSGLESDSLKESMPEEPIETDTIKFDTGYETAFAKTGHFRYLCNTE